MYERVKYLVTASAASFLLAWAASVPAADRVSLTDIESRLANIEAASYVPFRVQIGGGLCNSAAVGSANPSITIDGNGPDGTFLINSVLMRTDGIPANGFQFLSTTRLSIDGTAYDVLTANLAGPGGGSAIQHSFDILGTPVRTTSSVSEYSPGGNFPHEIVANSPGSSDINIRLFCRTDVENLNILSISVSGWKRPSETVTVTYTPGN